jgi:hypothetical protein
VNRVRVIREEGPYSVNTYDRILQQWWEGQRTEVEGLHYPQSGEWRDVPLEGE